MMVAGGEHVPLATGAFQAGRVHGAGRVRLAEWRCDQNQLDDGRASDEGLVVGGAVVQIGGVALRPRFRDRPVMSGSVPLPGVGFHSRFRLLDVHAPALFLPNVASSSLSHCAACASGSKPPRPGSCASRSSGRTGAVSGTSRLPDTPVPDRQQKSRNVLTTGRRWTTSASAGFSTNKPPSRRS